MPTHRSSFSHVTFRDMMYQARKEAILQECEHLLSEVGYEAMTLEQVAESAGIAKAVLYKHFKGKEDLCCEVMLRGIDRARDFLLGLPAEWSAYQRLCGFVRWVLQSQINADVTFIPERKSHIRRVVREYPGYNDALNSLSEVLDGLVAQAQAAGALHAGWPAPVARTMLLARAVDPMLDVLHETCGMAPEQAMDWCVRSAMTALMHPPMDMPTSAPVRVGSVA